MTPLHPQLSRAVAQGHLIGARQMIRAGLLERRWSHIATAFRLHLRLAWKFWRAALAEERSGRAWPVLPPADPQPSNSYADPVTRDAFVAEAMRRQALAMQAREQAARSDRPTLH